MRHWPFRFHLCLSSSAVAHHHFSALHHRDSYTDSGTALAYYRSGDAETRCKSDFYYAQCGLDFHLYLAGNLQGIYDKRIRDERAKKQRLLELDELKTPALHQYYPRIPHPADPDSGRCLARVAFNGNFAPTTARRSGWQARSPSAATPIACFGLSTRCSTWPAWSRAPCRYTKSGGNILPVLVYFIDSFRSMAERRKVRLHFLCSLTELDMDYDPDKVEDIISNLLSNAPSNSRHRRATSIFQQKY